MAQASRRIPKIPKKALSESTKEPCELKEFSGDLDGGTLWQVLGVEENLVRKILLLLDPVDLINLEKTSAFVRNLTIHFNVWKEKFTSDFRKMETLVDIAEKLDEIIEKADEVNSGNVLKSDHWCFKLKYVHCWNLEKNWEKGQYVFMENLYSHKNPAKNYAWNNIEQHTLSSTKHTVYREELFCHKNMIRSDNICDSSENKVVEVSDKHLLLFSSSEEAFKALLIEKHSLEVLAICFFRSYLVFLPQQFLTSLLDKTSCLIVHSNCIYSEICVVKFMLDDPKIWIEEIRTDECLRICSVRGPYSVGCSDVKIEVLHFDINNVPNGACSHKVWEKDISGQNTFPKIRYLSALVNFPFVYVSKSNGLLEVWDVTKDEVVKTVDHTDILGSQGELKPFHMEENGIEKVLCLQSINDLVVLNGKFMKKSQPISNNVGYMLNIVGGATRGQFFLDNTCIVYQRPIRGHMCKFDFWPIYPGNFKVKSVKCEAEKKPKKRKLPVPEQGGITPKNVRVESESEYSDNEEEYHYHEDDLYDYGVDRYDDHDQFYDDDNFVDDY